MTDLTISCIYCSYEARTGHIDFTLGDRKSTVQFSESELAEIRAIALGAWERDKQTLIAAIAEAKPLALTPPSYDDYEEVPF